MIRNKLTIAFLITAAMLTGSLSRASGECLDGATEVTLTGVIGAKATYIGPEEFGWVPVNGFVPYTVIYLDRPVCLREAGEYLGPTRIVQIASDEPLRSFEGRRASLRGQIFSNHTAHHFEALLIHVNEFTIHADTAAPAARP